jgi:hypothetical protein
MSPARASPVRDETTQPTAFALTEVKGERWDRFPYSSKPRRGGKEFANRKACQACAPLSVSSALPENSVLVFSRRAFCKASASNKWRWEEGGKD